MFCKQCGAQVPDGTSFCTQCGYPQNEQVQPFSQDQINVVQYVSIQTYLVHNILATLFCFFPLGIVGLIFSILAKNAISNGNIQAAKSNAHTAKVLFGISFGIGVFVVLLVLLFLERRLSVVG